MLLVPEAPPFSAQGSENLSFLGFLGSFENGLELCVHSIKVYLSSAGGSILLRV